MKGILKKNIHGFHLDYYRHVNNARYLEILEEGRSEFLKEIRDSGVLDEKGWYTIVVHIDISFKAELVLGDEIEIHSWISEHGRKSITCQQQIYRPDGKLASEAFVKFVIYDKNAAKSLFLTDEIKTLFPVSS